MFVIDPNDLQFDSTGRKVSTGPSKITLEYAEYIQVFSVLTPPNPL